MSSKRQKRAARKRAKQQTSTIVTEANKQPVYIGTHEVVEVNPTPERWARGVWHQGTNREGAHVDVASDMIGRLGYEGKLNGTQVEAARTFQELRAGYVAELGVPGYGSCLDVEPSGHDSGDGNVQAVRTYEAMSDRIGRIKTAILCDECDKGPDQQPDNLEVLRNALNVVAQ